MMTHRGNNEIEHGKYLAAGDTEHVWGWGTPAGKLRAKRRAELISAAAGLTTGMNVLEIGCGTGNFTELFAVSGSNILAVDISPDLLAKARERNLPQDQVQFMEMRFEDAQVCGPFDAVIGSSVLHHLELPRALEKIQALLKTGGKFSFAEPNMLNPQVYLERRFSHWPMFSHVSPDETAFIRWKLKQMMTEAGFSDIRIKPFDWLHPATPKALIPPVALLGRMLETLPLLREFSGSLLIQAMKA